MPAQTTNLFLLQDLEDSSKTRSLVGVDLPALNRVAAWIKTFIAQPHKDLGRGGSVCPFVPGAIARKSLWLAPERIAHLTVPQVLDLVDNYHKLLIRVEPAHGEDASYKALVVVFTDVTADRAKTYLEDAQLQQLKRVTYMKDGVVMGDFHERNEGSAIRNLNFQPFKAPVPFLLMRPAVVGDWMFFVDNDDWLMLWARRYGDAAVQALAEELRRTNWRQVDAMPPSADVLEPSPARTRT
jgi:hypothetical protein